MSFEQVLSFCTYMATPPLNGSDTNKNSRKLLGDFTTTLNFPLLLIMGVFDFTNGFIIRRDITEQQNYYNCVVVVGHQAKEEGQMRKKFLHKKYFAMSENGKGMANHTFFKNFIHVDIIECTTV